MASMTYIVGEHLRQLQPINEALNQKEPQYPPLARLNVMPIPQDYQTLCDNIGTGDHPLYVQAVIESAIRSDHPMMVAELKRFYMLAKLALCDEGRVGMVQGQIEYNKEHNRKVNEDNELRLDRHSQEVEKYNAGQEAARASLAEWWNNLADYLENALKDLPKDPKDFSVWQTVVFDSLDYASTCVEGLNKRWWRRRRDSKFTEFREIPDGSRVQIGTLLIERFKKSHKYFIQTQFQAVIDEISKRHGISKDVKAYMRETDNERQRWANRRLEYSFRYGSQYRDSYYDGYDREYSNRANAEEHEIIENANRRIVELKNQLVDEAWRVMCGRQAKGEDGYDEIYSPSAFSFSFHDIDSVWLYS